MSTEVAPAARPVTPVGIVSARLAALVGQAAAAGCEPAFASELAEIADLIGGLDPYLERNASPETPDRRVLASRTAHHDWTRGHRTPGLEQEMLSGNVEAQTLALLVRVTGARRVLEVGTFTGYATLAMAEALPDDGRVVTCEIDPTVARLAREAFDATDLGGRIDVREGPAIDSLGELAAAEESFDLVFVDADKAGYHTYVDTVLSSGLLASDGLLCVDNTLMQGEPWTGATSPNGRAIAQFNEALAADPRVRQVVVPLRDGLTLACREWKEST